MHELINKPPKHSSLREKNSFKKKLSKPETQHNDQVPGDHMVKEADHNVIEPMAPKHDSHFQPATPQANPATIRMAPNPDMDLIQEKDVNDESEDPEVQLAESSSKIMTMDSGDEGDDNKDENKSSAIQPKLKIGQPGDKYEKEADAVADRVMMISSQSQKDTVQMKPDSSLPHIQMKCKECEEELTLQMKPAIQKEQDDKSHASESTSNSLSSSAGMGQQMKASVQEDIGSKMGTDFSDVKIHTDSKAVQMNEELGARAFTHGSDIYFNSGNYNPGTSDGKHLLAHELTHVVQQTGKVQTFTPPDIQKFDAHEEIEDKIRGKNSEMITEVPIPGGETLGKGFTKFGYADLYKSTGSVISGIYGAKYREEEDETTGEKTKKYAYKNIL